MKKTSKGESQFALPKGLRTWEAASAVNLYSVSCQRGFFDDCPIYSLAAIPFDEAASIILGGTIVEENKYLSGHFLVCAVVRECHIGARNQSAVRFREIF